MTMTRKTKKCRTTTYIKAYDDYYDEFDEKYILDNYDDNGEIYQK